MSPPPFVSQRKIQDYAQGPTDDKLMRSLKSGDLILTCNASRAFQPVVAYQNQRRFARFPINSRKFTHVAIYLGQGQIVHSMPQRSLDYSLAAGVRQEPIHGLLPEGTTFAVLRYPGFTNEHRALIPDAVSIHLGCPYDYTGIIACLAGVPSAWRSALRRAVGMAQGQPTARALVCSDFVHVVFDELFQEDNPCNVEGGYPAPVFLPCVFFANPKFGDVDIDALDPPVAATN